MPKLKIGNIVGTIREGRFGGKPARWVFDIAFERIDLEFEIVDLRDYPPPLFDEAAGPAHAPPQNEVALGREDGRVRRAPLRHRGVHSRRR